MNGLNEPVASNSREIQNRPTSAALRDRIDRGQTGDKVPVVDSINDAVQTVIRPASGGIAFGAGASAETVRVDDPSAFIEYLEQAEGNVQRAIQGL